MAHTNVITIAMIRAAQKAALRACGLKLDTYTVQDMLRAAYEIEAIRLVENNSATMCAPMGYQFHND